MLLPTIPEGVVWSILLLPVASLLIDRLRHEAVPAALRLRDDRRDRHRLRCSRSGRSTASSTPTATRWHSARYEWLTIHADNPILQQLGGPNLDVDVGLRIDGLSAIMLVVVTSVSLLVQIYSQGYMDGDAGYSRYFA